MIKLEKTTVHNIDGALRGMRNPLNSWAKSDSFYCTEDCAKPWMKCSECEFIDRQYILGENDMNLCMRLIKGGTEHRKFLRQIMVCVDITAPLYWWKEFDTYKVGTTANSTSTMHTIHKREFEPGDFSFDYLSVSEIDEQLRIVERARGLYLRTKKKEDWYKLIQKLPSSYNQTRTITMNYENVMNMYLQRKHHKLDEWSTFCYWATKLPYFKEFMEV